MAVEENRIVIAAQLQSVATVIDFIGNTAAQAGLSEKAVHQCQLAVDEACTNIIEHGYANRHDQKIEVVARRENDQFVIEIIDASPPFNPLSQSDPNPDALLENRDHGGWGVYFIKRLMDEVTYVYSDNRNHLRLIKLLRPRLTLEVVNLYKHMRAVRLKGALDASIRDDLERALMGQFEKGIRYLILDMGTVDFISTEMLQMLVTIQKQARDRQGDIALTALTPTVQEMLELTSFDLVFTITRTVDEAVSRLRSG